MLQPPRAVKAALEPRAGAHRLFTVGSPGDRAGAAPTLWLHVIDACFARALRLRLLSKLVLAAAGLVSPAAGPDRRITLALHYGHLPPDVVAAVVAPVGCLAFICSSWTGEWRWSCSAGSVYLIITSTGARSPAQQWAEKMNGEAGGSYPRVSRYLGAELRRWLDEYTGSVASGGRWPARNPDGFGHLPSTLWLSLSAPCW